MALTFADHRRSPKDTPLSSLEVTAVARKASRRDRRTPTAPDASLALIACACLLAALSCAPDRPELALELDEGSRIAAAAFLEAHPLPKGVDLAAAGKAGGAAAVLRSGLRRGGPRPGDEGSKTVVRRWLVAPLPFAAGPLGYPDAAAASAAGPLVGLDGLGAGRRAAPVAGLLPGQDGYPLVEELYLRLEGSPSAELAAWFEALPEPAAGPVVIGAAGDMIVHGSRQGPVVAADGAPQPIFSDILAELMKIHYLIGNLEAPVSERGVGNPIKRYQFRLHPAVLKAFQAAGFDHLSFANNHTLDYGPEAFLDTLDWLDRLGIDRSGAGRNLAEASAPLRAEPAGLPISVLAAAFYPIESRGYSPAHAAAGPASPGILTDAALLRARIAEERAAGRFVVVLPHAGFEYVATPAPAIRELYRSFAEAGADLVLGTHPHVIQGIERHGRGTIAYSLGNFVFIGLGEEPPARRSGIFSFAVHGGSVIGYNFIPVTAGDDYSYLSPDAAEAAAYFMGLTEALAGE